MMILQQTRGVLSSGDGLALDLPFAETKSLTARVGPTPSFSRTSGGTYVGSDGLIHGVDTSTTSNSINTGSKTFILAAPANRDQMWKVGDAVEALNSTSNFMVGTVTSYTPSTQTLVCNITSVTGSGQFTSWRIGYLGPRFDHDPVTRHCRGLLIEERRENLLSRSEEFDNSYWITKSVTFGNPTIAPDGTTTADKIVETIDPLDHNVGRLNIVLSPQQMLTYSVFVKAAERFEIQLRLQEGFNVVDCRFNLNTLQITPINSGTGSGATGSIVAYPNGWYRCIITGRPSASTGTTVNAAIFLVNGGSNNYTGDGTSGLFIWGAQLEAGSFATSYIPTTTSSLARNADVCNITGADFTNLWNTSEGTMFINSTRTQPTGINFQPLFSANDGTNNNRVLIGNGGNPNDIEFNISTLGATEYNGNINNATTLIRRVALAYRGNSTNRSYNGNIGTDDTSSQLPTVNRAQFGNSQVIAAIRYYKKRLPNAKLQALTRFAPDIDAHDYIVSLLAARANVTPKQQNAINTFITTGKYEGWYPLLKRFYLPLWGAAAPNAIDLVTRTSGTFVGSITHGAGFVKVNNSNDPNAYFDFGVSPQALGLTQFDAGLMGWVDIAGGNRYLIGAYEINASYLALHTGDGKPNINFTCYSTSNDSRLGVLMETLPTDARSGIITGYGYDGSLSIYRRLGTSRIVVGSEAKVGAGTPPTTNIRAMGGYLISPTGLSTRTTNCYAFAAMKGMSNSMDEKFTAALNQFRTNMLS